MPESKPSWYYSAGGQQFGPVSGSQLRGLVARGKIAESDLVWKEGMSKWVLAKKVKGLFPEVQSYSPPPPPTNSGKPNAPNTTRDMFGIILSQILLIGQWVFSKILQAQTTAFKKGKSLAQIPVATTGLDGNPVESNTLSSGVTQNTSIVSSIVGLLMLLCMIMCVITSILDPIYNTTIEGDVARTSITTNCYSSVENTAFQCAEQVYKIATRYPDVKTIELTMIMSSSGLGDRYGNAVEKDLMMGTITIKNLDEVRKYKTYGAYSFKNDLFYYLEIDRMPNANFLRRRDE